MVIELLKNQLLRLEHSRPQIRIVDSEPHGTPVALSSVRAPAGHRPPHKRPHFPKESNKQSLAYMVNDHMNLGFPDQVTALHL